MGSQARTSLAIPGGVPRRLHRDEHRTDNAPACSRGVVMVASTRRDLWIDSGGAAWLEMDRRRRAHRTNLAQRATSARAADTQHALAEGRIPTAKRPSCDDCPAHSLRHRPTWPARSGSSPARRSRQCRPLRTALDLFDPGAQSPRETWLRFLLIREGFSPPRTQIPVLSPDGLRRYY